MRILLSLVAVVGALAASSASAAAPPTYSVSFTGNGSEHQLDHQQNIQDSGVCDSAEHLDVTASLAWTATWPGLKATGQGHRRPARRGSTARRWRAATSRMRAASTSASRRPAGSASEAAPTRCAVSAEPSISVRKTAASLVLAVTAPSFAVPVGAGCSLNVRNDQLSAHAVVPLKKLQALKKRGSIAIAVGTVRPGPGDVYSPVDRLLAADEAVRRLPHRRPLRGQPVLERHGQGHAHRLIARQTSGNERCARGGARKFWRCVA